jgi:hypothetical protein
LNGTAAYATKDTEEILSHPTALANRSGGVIQVMLSKGSCYFKEGVEIEEKED